MIVALPNHGRGELALDHFSRMICEKIKPNCITFIAVWSACSHVGLVDKGMKYFKSMKDVHGISPEPEHYRCMVDSLGRARQLQEARKLIRSYTVLLLSYANIWVGFYILKPAKAGIIVYGVISGAMIVSSVALEFWKRLTRDGNTIGANEASASNNKEDSKVEII
ncbi:hypothetical protein Vadar_029065 [Vaccinium darrowii]|uniref:Uncharacterized protein n=1 Tax=Vaccinium darrowii TaxID=229202 RepID=A0ACB7YZ25_9ERIC|nr:hypothetical protein Vadar_029065 [Vaccinium darrowii]